MALTILFEDERVLVLDKPSGQLVIPGRTPSPQPSLREEIEQTRNQKIFVVHRLDRGASGIVLFAKDSETHRHLCREFEQRRVAKDYRVVVEGLVEKERGVIQQPLHAFGSGRMGVDPRGKPSQTIYSVVKRFEKYTLLEVQPKTGRQHQIRAHFFWLGHPVLGDDLYGKNRPVGGATRLLLHASSIELVGPGQKKYSFQSSLPADFSAYTR